MQVSIQKRMWIATSPLLVGIQTHNGDMAVHYAGNNPVSICRIVDKASYDLLLKLFPLFLAMLHIRFM